MIDDRIVKGCWDIITYDRVEEACREMDMLESVITDIASGDSIAVLDDDLQKISRYIRRPDFLSCGCKDEKYEDMLNEGPIDEEEVSSMEVHTRLTLVNNTDRVLRVEDILRLWVDHGDECLGTIIDTAINGHDDQVKEIYGKDETQI